VAIVLLLVEMLFPERKREPKTRPASAPPGQLALRTAATVLLLALLPTSLRASPASALREYKAGQYDQALKEYEQLLKRKGDDPRLHFNAGAAAYRNQQFEEAAKQFNATLAAPDLKLQGLSYYNEGNALYHLGEQNPDPKKRTEAWEKAVQDYQSTAKLNPQDEDAKFNYEFVRRKLEELKQQQQQSQQGKSDQQKDEDKKQEQQNQQQQQQNQQKKDQQQQQQAQQKQSEEKKDSAQQEQQKKQSEQQQQQAAKRSQEQKEKQQQEQQQAKQSPEQPKDKGDEKEQEAAAAHAAGQMTPQQAQQLLDAQKGDEQMLPPQPTGKPVDRSRPIKDW
jgi:Ca-activated chloride channel family protein